jgi:hypothetical protein
MVPLLLRGAAVLALAGAIAGVVSTSALVSRPEVEESGPTLAMVQAEPGAAMVAAVAGDEVVEAWQVAPEAAVTDLNAFPVPKEVAAAPIADPIAGAAPTADPVAEAPVQPEPLPETVPQPQSEPSPAAVAAVEQPAEQGSAEAGETPPQPVAPAAPASDTGPGGSEPTLSATVLAAGHDAVAAAAAGPATECPRDWLPADQADVPAGCGEGAALLESVAIGEDKSAVEEAAIEHAAQLAGLQFAPRIPQARPEPPARPRKAVARGKRASWPADKPPNCGSKRAKWRYVNDVPTWYCK